MAANSTGSAKKSRRTVNIRSHSAQEVPAALTRHALHLVRRCPTEGSSLNGVPSEQPQLLHLLAEAAQTSQRLVFFSGELELLELEDLQCEQNGAAATRVY